MITSEPLVEVAVLARDKNKTFFSQGTEAQLNFVSLRSSSHYVGFGLSRVEMNALRAPLTALPTLKGNVCRILA
jgi:hypothetical protein